VEVLISIPEKEMYYHLFHPELIELQVELHIAFSIYICLTSFTIFVNYSHDVHVFLVDGMTVTPVGSFDEIRIRMNEGERQRTIAATKMNETSRYVGCKPRLQSKCQPSCTIEHITKHCKLLSHTRIRVENHLI